MTTKRERVMAVLRGEPVDRVPIAFWLHNFAAENSAEGLAGETLRLARTFDWDYLKPQSRAQCFAEMWGLRYQPSGERAVPYTVTHAPVADAVIPLETAVPAPTKVAAATSSVATVFRDTGDRRPSSACSSETVASPCASRWTRRSSG